jgi:SAM-dependent methyltransferase
VTAADSWRDALAAWALPEHILAGAEESPWIHPPELFALPAVIASTPSHERAREAMPPGGSVLDVGCGGGIAAFAVAPPASRVIGVDHQAAMLAMFEATAAARGLSCATIEGFWPAVAKRVEVADVVTCHHVVYNVGDITPFLAGLSEHARSRVVIEMPDHHPLSAMSDAWRHFWDLERPVGPTPDDLLTVLAEMGISAQRERFVAPPRSDHDPERAAHFARIRLCLPAAREREVADYLASQPAPVARNLSTIWWDI